MEEENTKDKVEKVISGLKNGVSTEIDGYRWNGI